MTAKLSLARITRALHDHFPGDPATSRLGARAAVAMVLYYSGSAPSVLLMTRAERDGDRWSGQVSLPGGREEEEDADLLATAVRETREEVGLDLGRRSHLLGRLRPIQARARGKLLPMSIDPFVFHCPEKTPLTLGEEAVEAFWFPLAEAAAGEHASTFELSEGSSMHSLPCWRYEGRVIWGLTFEMLRGFLRLLRDERGAGS